MHPDLTTTKQLVYDPCGYVYTNFLLEHESAEYAACTFNLNDATIKFRSAKITPTKTGQFVTLWKRDKMGITQPHDGSDTIDLFVISVRKDHLLGQFVFPKHVLLENGILSSPTKEGKRGFRVYPPWDVTSNKQAQKTQKWQLDFFLSLPTHEPLDKTRAAILYKMNPPEFSV